jgi:hypothetical protein
LYHSCSFSPLYHIIACVSTDFSPYTQTTAPESGAAADIWELLLYGPAAKVQYCLALKKQIVINSRIHAEKRLYHAA